MFFCNCCRLPRVPLPSMPSLKCKIPMKSVSFNSIIQNSLVNLSIIQVFQNQEQKPLEVQYTFSLSEDTVISSLRIHLQDNTILVAKIKESERAAEIYQDSISTGNTAVLGELDENKKMTISIGNLAPGDLVKVEFILAFPMSSDESAWKMSVPQGFLPAEFADPIEFSFAIQIIASKMIQNYSSSVGMTWNLSPDKLKLLGESQESVLRNQLDHALWVKYKAEDSNKPTLLYQMHEEKVYALVSFVPFSERIQKLEEAEGQGEFIFVLDRSGSMGGDRIEMAKKATVLFLKSLPANSYFNIISFGSEYENMFHDSQLTSSHNIDQAINSVNSFTANLGGTNIYKPLSSIFRQSLMKNFSRTIFLLTDGQVENSNLVIQLIKENSNSCRVHSFGIGSDFDRNLIKNSAKAGKGCWNFVENNEEIGQKVISALMKSIVPCVSQWEISMQGESYPIVAKIGNIYYGERFVQYYLLDKIPEDGIRLKYFDDFEKRTVESFIGKFDFAEGNQIFKLWAKMKIEHLSKESAKNSEVIKNLSIRAGIPSSLTSFICVKENEEPVVGELVSKVIKIQEILEEQFLPQAAMCFSMRSAPIPPPPGSCFNSYRSAPLSRNSVIPPNCGMPPAPRMPPGHGPSPVMHPAPVMLPVPLMSSPFKSAFVNCMPPGNPMNNMPRLAGMPPGPGMASGNRMPPPPGISANFEMHSGLPNCAMSPPILMSNPFPLNQPNSYSLSNTASVQKDNIPLDPFSSLPSFNQGLDAFKPVPKSDQNFDCLDMLVDTLGTKPQPDPFHSHASNQNKPPGTKITKIDYMKVITLQKTEGFWVLNEVSKHIPEVLSFISNLTSITNNENEACTIFILGYLEAFFENKRPEWLLVMRKAVNWLKSFNIDYNSIKSTILPLLTSN